MSKIGKALIILFLICLMFFSFMVGHSMEQQAVQKQFIRLAQINSDRNKQIKTLKRQLANAKRLDHASTETSDYRSIWTSSTASQKAAWALYAGDAYNQGINMHKSLVAARTSQVTVTPMDTNSGTINIAKAGTQYVVYYKYDTSNDQLMFQYKGDSIQSVSFPKLIEAVADKKPISPVRQTMFTRQDVNKLARNINLTK